MPPARTWYVFAETQRKPECFTAGRHQCLPYSKDVVRVNTYKHQFIRLPRSPDRASQRDR